MGILTLLGALAMALVAAWFAIAGIVAFFAGLPVAAIAMGLVIEAGKLLGISWVYRNWEEPTLLKYAAIPFILIMMLLTSAGIYGYLSKAHLEQNAPVINNELRIDRIDQQISREEVKIADAEAVIGQLDTTVQTLIEYAKISGENGARSVRAGQQDQRDLYAQVISSAQSKIDKYEDSKLTLNQELKAVELELGPVKYLAALIFDNPEDNIEQASRILILMFIFVFDPMAIMLLMMANYTLMRNHGPELDLSDIKEQFAHIVDEDTPPATSPPEITEEIVEPEVAVPNPEPPAARPAAPGKFWARALPKYKGK